MKILKYIKNKFRKTMSVEEFADVLGCYFYDVMIKNNHSTFYEMLSKSGIEIDREDLKLEADWELTIFDMFIITHCCRLILTNKEICKTTLDLFHRSLYNANRKVDKRFAQNIQEMRKIRYKAYFEILGYLPDTLIEKALKGTLPTSENPIYLLSKELVKNIYGEEVHSAIKTYNLSIYITGSLKFTTNFINDILRKHNLELKRS